MVYDEAAMASVVVEMRGVNGSMNETIYSLWNSSWLGTGWP